MKRTIANFNPPLISIALCTCNGERYLREQLRSLANQEYQNYEIVVVDDASEDGSVSILNQFKRSGLRIKIYNNIARIGILQNFAKAINLCSGDFIALCDQDDVWLPRKLTRLQEAIQDAPMVYADSELIGENGESLGRRVSDMYALSSIDDPKSFLFQNCVSGHAMLFRREVACRALPFPPAMFHDEWLAWTASQMGMVRFYPEVLVLYRQHAGAATDMSGLRRGSRKRMRGGKAREMNRIEQRLGAFAARAHEPDQQFFAEVLRLWQRRERAWMCWRLTRLLLRHRNIVYAFIDKRHARRVRCALRYFWGLRVKQLVQRMDYAG